MKNIKTLLFLLAAIVAVSCSNSTETKAQADMSSEKNNSEIVEGKTINMDKAMFLERVMDFEKNKETWIYLGDKPAIIDFYADWCKPCKLIAPIMEELAAEYKGQLYIYKVDTQVERELASVFGIRSIPAVLFIPMEGKPQMSTGALPKETFKDAIDNFLLKPASENTSTENK
ncbi:MAG: thioredoxin domain-containing protein [Bacteroidales bacterium]|jgi:thioredoxin|nr:thioredoxin domain-containing protein [Bacteroidales bacterium]